LGYHQGNDGGFWEGLRWKFCYSKWTWILESPRLSRSTGLIDDIYQTNFSYGETRDLGGHLNKFPISIFAAGNDTSGCLYSSSRKSQPTVSILRLLHLASRSTLPFEGMITCTETSSFTPHQQRRLRVPTGSELYLCSPCFARLIFFLIL